MSLAGEDQEHLQARFESKKLMASETDENSWDRITDAIKLVEANAAVSINIHPESLVSILQDRRIRYVNLHDNLRAGALLGYSPDLEAKRKGIDCLAFGADWERLNFGALNLGTIGLYSYGACCVFLRKEVLINRTSFLEKNSFSYYCSNGASISFHIPAGVRALWANVAQLTVLKHHDAIVARSKLDKVSMAELILVSSGDKATDDFVEAQVLSPITLDCFEKILYDPNVARPIRDQGIVGQAAVLSRRILGEYLKSLEGDIEVEVRP